jgi:hypothetical protein
MCHRSTSPPPIANVLCLLHNLPKIVHKKQKINETLLLGGINFALCKEVKKSFQNQKILDKFIFGLLEGYISHQKFTKAIFLVKTSTSLKRMD